VAVMSLGVKYVVRKFVITQNAIGLYIQEVTRIHLKNLGKSAVRIILQKLTSVD